MVLVGVLGLVTVYIVTTFYGFAYAKGEQDKTIEYQQEQTVALNEYTVKVEEQQRKLDIEVANNIVSERRARNLEERLRRESHSSPTADRVCFNNERLRIIQTNSASIRRRGSEAENHNQPILESTLQPTTNSRTRD